MGIAHGSEKYPETQVSELDAKNIEVHPDDFSKAQQLIEDVEITNKQSFTPEQLTQIREYKASLQKKYGVTCLCLTAEVNEELALSTHEITLIDSFAILQEQFLMIDQELGKYPVGSVKGSSLKKILLTSGDNMMSDGKESGGRYDHGTGRIVVSYYYNNYDNFALHHEFFHLLDHEIDDMSKDNASWSNLGTDTLREYGKKNSDEDQADFGGYMMANLLDVAQAAVSNETILRKLEVMTGCKFNMDSSVFEEYTEDEFTNKYSRYGFTTFEYYKKRSQGTMGADFRNNLLAGKRVMTRKREAEEKGILETTMRQEVETKLRFIVTTCTADSDVKSISLSLHSLFGKVFGYQDSGTFIIPDMYLGINDPHGLKRIVIPLLGKLLQKIDGKLILPHLSQETSPVLYTMINEMALLSDKVTPHLVPIEDNLNIFAAKYSYCNIEFLNFESLIESHEGERLISQWIKFAQDAYDAGVLHVIIDRLPYNHFMHRFFELHTSDLDPDGYGIGKNAANNLLTLYEQNLIPTSYVEDNDVDFQVKVFDFLNKIKVFDSTQGRSLNKKERNNLQDAIIVEVEKFINLLLSCQETPHDSSFPYSFFQCMTHRYNSQLKEIVLGFDKLLSYFGERNLYNQIENKLTSTKNAVFNKQSIVFLQQISDLLQQE